MGCESDERNVKENVRGIQPQSTLIPPSNLWGTMTLPPFFYQVFEFLPRQGPGCAGATKKVFSLLPPLPDNANILDVGCGSGTQTRDLAGLTPGIITAVDNH